MSQTEISNTEANMDPHQLIYVKVTGQIMNCQREIQKMSDFDSIVKLNTDDDIIQELELKFETSYMSTFKQYMLTGYDINLEENDKSSDVWQSNIDTALTVDGVLRIISLIGFDDVKAHITRLRKLLHEDGYDDSIDLKSIKNFALFLINHFNVSRPHVGISPDGFIDARWDIPDYVTLVMEFLPADEISFAAVFDEHESAHGLHYVSGRSSSESIMKDIDSIGSHLMI